MYNTSSALLESPREEKTQRAHAVRHLKIVPDAPEERADRRAKQSSAGRVALPIVAALTMVALLEAVSASWAALLVLATAFVLLGFASTKSGKDSRDGFNWRSESPAERG